MAGHSETLDEILNRLNALSSKQEIINKEITALNEAIKYLKAKDASLNDASAENQPKAIDAEPQFLKPDVANQVKKEPLSAPIQPIGIYKQKKSKSELEKFIGEHILSTIGILVTVLGVAIGAKYAIDKDLITPLGRIISGYIFGLIILGTAFKLKQKFLNYSAILLSGAMAIFYFITFSAYSYYALIPQLLAFSLMVVFTSFTVTAAINYNKQIIAHIGLVGAYAVPLLLSDGSGKFEILYSYITIINIGILFIAIKKYWKPLNFSSLAFTYLIFATWLFSKYQTENFIPAFTFLVLFYLIFYTAFLTYRIRNKEHFDATDIILLLANAFIFYGLGYYLISQFQSGHKFLGIFTIVNASIHFIAAFVVYKQKLADKNLFYLLAGLVMVFITIAVPVQLDGNWVTLLWATEAVLLYWIGSSRNIIVYEKLAVPLMILAFYSQLNDWNNTHYSIDERFLEIPLLNIRLLSALFLAATYLAIYKIYLNKKDNADALPTDFKNHKSSANDINQFIKIGTPLAALLIIYFSFSYEITKYFDKQYALSYIADSRDEDGYANYLYNADLLTFKSLWLICYSMFFLILASWFNIKKLDSKLILKINIIGIILAICYFLFEGLYLLRDLRASYLFPQVNAYYQTSSLHLFIRYIPIALCVFLLFTLKKILDKVQLDESFSKYSKIFTYSVLLIIASNELVHWMELFGSRQAFKLGLSILWGAYALLLIMIGIRTGKQYLRIAAMVLFGFTLLKLFFYDIAHLNTIYKTVVLISLGILLLIISFLYVKFKTRISNEKSD